jgi:uncharacterized protein (DUF1015 family)
MQPGAAVPPPHVARPLRLGPFRATTLAADRLGDGRTLRAFARPYDDVAARLERWAARGHATRDAAPAVYLHELTSAGLTIRGLVGVLDSSRRAERWEDVAVHPHEGVHPDQVADLADRLREMQVDPAPILLVHRGDGALRALLDRVQQRTPLRALTDRVGRHHRLWALTDPAEVAEVDAALAGASALIADGHHRYAAAVRLGGEEPGAADAGLAMLVDQDDTPLFVGAIHRALPGATLGGLRAAAAAAEADVLDLDAAHALAALAPDTLVATDGEAWIGVRLVLAPGRAAVEALHDDVLPQLRRRTTRISYHHDAEGALRAVRRGRGLAVLMPAPALEDVFGAALAGRLLPEKATSFQPKPGVGVLIRSRRDG